MAVVSLNSWRRLCSVAVLKCALIFWTLKKLLSTEQLFGVQFLRWMLVLFPQLPRSHAEITGTSYHIWFLSFIFFIAFEADFWEPKQWGSAPARCYCWKVFFEVITSLISDLCCSAIRFHSDCADFAIWRQCHHGDSINAQAHSCLSSPFCSRVWIIFTTWWIASLFASDMIYNVCFLL